MDGSAPVIASLVPIVVAIGGGFGFLINKIVTSSKDAVDEVTKTAREREQQLQERLDNAEAKADLWQDRAYKAGWKEDV